MTNQQPVSVLTTTQPPTRSVRQLSEALRQENIPLVVIGDKKGPFQYELPGAELFCVERQRELSYSLAKALPYGHYSRKNLGYLIAFEQGATCIYETDDDNAPLPTWKIRRSTTKARHVHTEGWVNVYRAFSEENIWPRGFPLDLSRAPFPVNGHPFELVTVDAPIQQGLVNGSPDVDAVWRLVMDRSVTFRNGESVYLGRHAWCPFNSQSTWWWPAAYPLLYLPSYCSFRMTDIWRSFVAQRCLWELDTGVVFHGAEVIQERNEHNLMTNFQDEISGYLKNKQISDALAHLSLKGGIANVGQNLLACYGLLVENEIIPGAELDLVRAWLDDVFAIQSRATSPALAAKA